jgi:drug/metabolite transporter (DMT)-like permease
VVEHKPQVSELHAHSHHSKYDSWWINSGLAALFFPSQGHSFNSNNNSKNNNMHYLVLAGACFALGFLATNCGFSGSSAAFVETIKAAEPITSAGLAVWWKIESLSQPEVASLASIVAGVLLSTLGNSNGGDDAADKLSASASTTSSTGVVMASLASCLIVMAANLCFSFRGLYQKLFRKSHPAHVVDDLNLQYRMQQIGIGLLLVPLMVWNLSGILRHVYLVSSRVGLWQSGVLVRYTLLSIVNGLAFTSYK